MYVEASTDLPGRDFLWWYREGSEDNRSFSPRRRVLPVPHMEEESEPRYCPIGLSARLTDSQLVSVGRNGNFLSNPPWVGKRHSTCQEPPETNPAASPVCGEGAWPLPARCNRGAPLHSAPYARSKTQCQLQEVSVYTHSNFLSAFKCIYSPFFLNGVKGKQRFLPTSWLVFVLFLKTPQVYLQQINSLIWYESVLHACCRITPEKLHHKYTDTMSGSMGSFGSHWKYSVFSRMLIYD